MSSAAVGAKSRTSRTISNEPKRVVDWTPIFGFDVFISYKRQECSLYAGSLERQLRDRDLRCFLDDNDIPPGAPLSKTVRSALSRSRVLVVILSAGSMQSRYVRDEVHAFLESMKPVVPIRLSNAFSYSVEPEGHTASTGSSVKDLLENRELVWIDERENIT